jgi:hypothetical protein
VGDGRQAAQLLGEEVGAFDFGEGHGCDARTSSGLKVKCHCAATVADHVKLLPGLNSSIDDIMCA